MKHIDRRQIQTIFHYRQKKPSQRTGPVWQPVLMTNFPIILNRLTGMFSEDRSEFIASFDEYDFHERYVSHTAFWFEHRNPVSGAAGLPLDIPIL